MDEITMTGLPLREAVDEVERRGRRVGVDDERGRGAGAQVRWNEGPGARNECPGWPEYALSG